MVDAVSDLWQFLAGLVFNEPHEGGIEIGVVEQAIPREVSLGQDLTTLAGT